MREMSVCVAGPWSADHWGKGWAASVLFYTLLAALHLCELTDLALMLPGTNEGPSVPRLGTAEAKLFILIGRKTIFDHYISVQAID